MRPAQVGALSPLVTGRQAAVPASAAAIQVYKRMFRPPEFAKDSRCPVPRVELTPDELLWLGRFGAREDWTPAGGFPIKIVDALIEKNLLRWEKGRLGVSILGREVLGEYTAGNEPTS